MPPPLKPAYAIWGEDRAKVERTVERLIARVADEGGMEPDRFDAAEDATGGDVATACQTLSFGGLRVVIVEHADRWKVADVEPLVDYLAEPNPMTLVAFVSAGAPAQKLVKAVERVGDLLNWGLPAKASPRERRAWLEAHFASEVTRFGGATTPAVTRRVVELVVVDRNDSETTSINAMTLTSEAEKLALLAAGQTITREMVDDAVASHPDAKAYELSDAIAAGDRARTFGLLADLAGGDKRSAPILVQMALVSHFRGVAVAQSLGAKATDREVMDAAGVGNPWAAKKIVEHARAMAPGGAEHAVVRLARLELDLRVSAYGELGRSRDDGGRFVLENAARDLLEITRGGKN